VRPKLVASTATIRRAREQVFQLYLRQVNVFPPPGLDARDNFFAVQRPPSAAVPGRTLCGDRRAGHARQGAAHPRLRGGDGGGAEAL
jgi:hypothetical protein